MREIDGFIEASGVYEEIFGEERTDISDEELVEMTEDQLTWDVQGAPALFDRWYKLKAGKDEEEDGN
jgi:hypothetical protein